MLMTLSRIITMLFIIRVLIPQQYLHLSFASNSGDSTVYMEKPKYTKYYFKQKINSIMLKSSLRLRKSMDPLQENDIACDVHFHRLF